MIFINRIKFEAFQDLYNYLCIDSDSRVAYDYAASLWDTPEAESQTEHIFISTVEDDISI